ncbi:MAG: hypothetical protein R6W68_08015 [Ignavibacteriaceae bacterium]
MKNNSIIPRRLIKDVEAVQRFRNILFYQRHVSHSAFLLLFLLQYPLLFLLSYISSDPQFIIKVALGVIAAAAILFTPYIFYILINEKKFGWIITFFAMIIIPLLLAHVLFHGEFVYEGLVLIPLASFYFYCYLIKFEVDKWLGEYYSYQELLNQKKDRDERFKNEF